MASTITSITGLQNLSNLLEFRADYNSFETVDLSGLSNLTYVDISDCEVPGSNENSLKSVNLSGCSNLQELRLDDSDFSGGFPDLTGLNNLNWIDFDQCDLIGTVNISNLPSLIRVDLSGNTNLNRVIISSSQPIGNGADFSVQNCALTQPAVDNILMALAQNGINDGYADLSGGTNAIPSAIGLAAKAGLEGNGWTVNVNTP